MRVRRVETVEEALNTLAEFGDAAQPVAGGTDVMIQLFAERDLTGPPDADP